MPVKRFEQLEQDLKAFIHNKTKRYVNSNVPFLCHTDLKQECLLKIYELCLLYYDLEYNILKYKCIVAINNHLNNIYKRYKKQINILFNEDLHTSKQHTKLDHIIIDDMLTNIKNELKSKTILNSILKILLEEDNNFNIYIRDKPKYTKTDIAKYLNISNASVTRYIKLIHNIYLGLSK